MPQERACAWILLFLQPWAVTEHISYILPLSFLFIDAQASF
jgi:hypothetical protein